MEEQVAAVNHQPCNRCDSSCALALAFCWPAYIAHLKLVLRTVRPRRSGSYFCQLETEAAANTSFYALKKNDTTPHSHSNCCEIFPIQLGVDLSCSHPNGTVQSGPLYKHSHGERRAGSTLGTDNCFLLHGSRDGKLYCPPLFVGEFVLLSPEAFESGIDKHKCLPKYALYITTYLTLIISRQSIRCNQPWSCFEKTRHRAYILNNESDSFNIFSQMEKATGNLFLFQSFVHSLQ